MSNRAIRKAIQSLRSRVLEHSQKINQERMRPFPDEDIITYWESEIQSFTLRIRRLEHRLAQKRQHGRS